MKIDKRDFSISEDEKIYVTAYKDDLEGQKIPSGYIGCNCMYTIDNKDHDYSVLFAFTLAEELYTEGKDTFFEVAKDLVISKHQRWYKENK